MTERIWTWWFRDVTLFWQPLEKKKAPLESERKKKGGNFLTLVVSTIQLLSASPNDRNGFFLHFISTRSAGTWKKDINAAAATQRIEILRKNISASLLLNNIGVGSFVILFHPFEAEQKKKRSRLYQDLFVHLVRQIEDTKNSSSRNLTLWQRCFFYSIPIQELFMLKSSTSEPLRGKTISRRTISSTVSSTISSTVSSTSSKDGSLELQQLLLYLQNSFPCMVIEMVTVKRLQPNLI